MDETQYEYHSNVKEFFPMRETVKGRKQFSKKISGAAGLLATASAGILAAAVTLLLLFCNTTEIGASYVSFRTTVCNAKDATQIFYYVLPYETVSQNMEIHRILHGRPTGPDTEGLFLRNAVASGPVSSGRETFRVDGLEPNTRYVIVFFDANPDGQRILNILEFTTGDPGLPEEPPTPVETIPSPPTEETSAPTETVPETTEETEPETTEETQPETVPETTEPPYRPPVYIPPEPTTPPPTETVPPPTETVPPEDLPQSDPITVEGPIRLSDGRTWYRISTEIDMKGYAFSGVEVRLEKGDEYNNGVEFGWDQPNDRTLTVSGQVYLEVETSVQIIVYYDRNGTIAEVSSEPVLLTLFENPDAEM